MKKLEYHQKFFLKFMLIISIIAICIIAFNILRISSIKAKVIEEAINTAYEVKFKNVNHGELLVKLDRPVKCNIAGLSTYKCLANNIGIHVDDDMEIAKINNITLIVHTPLFATGLKELISSSTKIYIQATGIDVALWEDLFEADNLSGEIKQSISSYIVPHAKNISYKGMIKDIQVLKRNHRGTPSEVTFNFFSEMNSNYLRATYKMALLFKQYDSLKEFVVIRQPIEAPDLNQTMSTMEEIVYTANQDVFIKEARLCFESKDNEFIKKGLHSYYKMLFSFAPNKAAFNKAVLNVDTDKSIEYNSFASILKPLLKEATNTNLLGINQFVLNFIQNIYENGTGVCETTIAKSKVGLSMAGMGALSSQNFYKLEDVVNSYFDSNLTKMMDGVHENTNDWFK